MNAELLDDERRGEDFADLASDRDRLVLRAHLFANDCEFVASHSRRVAASAHRAGKPVADLLQNRVADRMPVNVVDRLEAVEVEQADRERLRARLSRVDAAGEQRLKTAPVGEPGQIVGVGDGGGGLPGVFRGAVHFGDHEAGADDLGERLGVVDQHVANESGDRDQETGHPVGQIVAVDDERHDERDHRTCDDENRGPHQAHQAERRRDRGRPDGDQQQGFLDNRVRPHENSGDKRKPEHHRRPDKAGVADVAAHDFEALAIDPGAHSHPVDESGHHDREQQTGEAEGDDGRGPGARGVEQGRRRENRDPVKERRHTGQGPILLAELEGVEVRVDRSRPGPRSERLDEGRKRDQSHGFRPCYPPNRP